MRSEMAHTVHRTGAKGAEDQKVERYLEEDQAGIHRLALVSNSDTKVVSLVSDVNTKFYFDSGSTSVINPWCVCPTTNRISLRRGRAGD
jgi:hypothetical protein